MGGLKRGGISPIPTLCYCESQSQPFQEVSGLIGMIIILFVVDYHPQDG